MSFYVRGCFRSWTMFVCIAAILAVFMVPTTMQEWRRQTKIYKECEPYRGEEWSDKPDKCLQLPFLLWLEIAVTAIVTVSAVVGALFLILSSFVAVLAVRKRPHALG